jgi:phage terminase Nu1 subunit (DNA packaging protein)
MAATNPQLSAAREELVRIQTEERRLKVARLRGELITIDEHKRALDSELASIRAAVLSLPGRITRELPHLTRTDRVVIDRLTRALLNELADAEPSV